MKARLLVLLLFTQVRRRTRKIFLIEFSGQNDNFTTPNRAEVRLTTGLNAVGERTDFYTGIERSYN